MSQFFQYLLNFGVLGIVFIAMWTGLLYTKVYVDELKRSHEERLEEIKDKHEEEVNELKQALALERQRSDIGITAGTILRDIAAEVRKGIVSP